MIAFPSPAISIVGRHNSGKTTLIEKLISELVARGFDVGSVKHHSHVGFEIDIPGKDSYRHRHAGTTETVIACPGQMARIQTVRGEVECNEIVASMPGHDIVIVEGYRKSGLPTIEIMRSGNDADVRTAAAFAEGAKAGWSLGTDFTQFGRNKHVGEASSHEAANADEAAAANAAANATDAVSAAVNAANATDAAANATDDRFATQAPDYNDISNKLPTESTVAIVTDIPEAASAAAIYGIPAFDINDVAGVANFVETQYTRPRVSVVIQAGGESRRMGRSKATVPFCGRPLITRLVKRMAPVADELIITTNEPENLAFLKTDFPDLEIQLVRDCMDERGALPGLYTALQAAHNPYVAAIACDMVFASPALVVAEAVEMTKTGADVVVPVNKHGFEPFHSVYRRMACLPVVAEVIKTGEKRAQSFFNQVNVVHFSQEQVLKAEPMGGCFINANTPDELAALEQIVRAQEK